MFWCARGKELTYIHSRLLQPAPGLASYTLGQKTIISEHYAQIDQVPIYIVHDMASSRCATELFYLWWRGDSPLGTQFAPEIQRQSEIQK
ncbi:hypothetical protein ACN38_g12876 [Penicillium nordicum]|uniref:Uncharacterized protein n=1 Tax=Penicillium nordicum TaxID=229535 RepID=A0A0M8NSI1_9EURO|nr:hypothetical protein ACN38_g12876 [Penicillium nordicum]